MSDPAPILTQTAWMQRKIDKENHEIDELQKLINYYQAEINKANDNPDQAI